MSNSNNTGSNHVVGAITYTGSSNGAQVVPVQPRQPRNLQGLLRFAMEATKAEDAPGNSELGPMDDERRKFLEEALKNLTVNVAEVLLNAIKVLSDSDKIHGIQLSQALPEDVQVAFNNLMEFVDDIDIANDFYKMGGFAVFPVCYGSENDEVRARASSLLGELCQNNPQCQARALECGLLNVLLSLVQSERGDALAKCLYAISCISRECPAACSELVSQGACEPLAQLTRCPHAATRSRAAFFVRYLCRNRDDAREQFINLNLVRTLAEQLKGGRDEASEHLLGALAVLVQGLDPTVVQQCRDPRLGLRETLEGHLRHPDLQSDRFAEEKEYCQDLLEQLFADSPSVEEVIDEVADR